MLSLDDLRELRDKATNKEVAKTLDKKIEIIEKQKTVTK